MARSVTEVPIIASSDSPDHGVDRGLVVSGDPAEKFKVGNVGALRGGAGKELVRMVNVQGNLMLLATVGGAIQMVAFIWQASRQ